LVDPGVMELPEGLDQFRDPDPTVSHYILYDHMIKYCEVGPGGEVVTTSSEVRSSNRPGIRQVMYGIFTLQSENPAHLEST
ncbi:hypothetical protein L9F63_016297, partial [Diploptera punctata]